MANHTVFLGIMNSDMIEPVIQNLKRTKYQAYIGNNVKSFSELANNCIKECTTEIFLFCSHRVSPTDDDIDCLISLLNAGYGYVGFYRMACFGIHKDIINEFLNRKIDMSDQKMGWGVDLCLSSLSFL